MNTQNTKIVKLAEAALLAALCYVFFTFFKIDITVPGGEKTAFHAGNAFCVLGALLFGGWYGGAAGAVGMTIADLTSGYATSAPKTFVLKLCIGLIVGLIAHKCAKINETNDKKYIFRWSLIAAVAGLGFNVFADPIVGYFYKQYLLGIPQEVADIWVKINGMTTLVNAVLSAVLAMILYAALRPALIKANLLHVDVKTK